MKSLNPSRPARALLLVSLLGAVSSVAAQEPDRQARNWASSCAACHGTDGRTVGYEVPSLAGRDAGQLFRALTEFRSDQRPAATVMHQHAKGYTDEQLRRIADWFARQPAR
ncbi:MAG: hypothetical protein RIS35_3261 [Pseudomonadota bacterium]